MEWEDIWSFKYPPPMVGVVQAVLQRNANYSYCVIGKDGVDSPTQFMANGWLADASPPFSCATIGIYIDIVNNVSYAVNANLIRGHFSVTGSVGGANSTSVGTGLTGTTFIYPVDYNRAPPLIWQPNSTFPAPRRLPDTTPITPMSRVMSMPSRLWPRPNFGNTLLISGTTTGALGSTMSLPTRDLDRRPISHYRQVQTPFID